MLSNHSAIRVALCLAVGGLIVSSCTTGAGARQQQEASGQEEGSDVPAWFLGDRPMDPNHIFAAATATAPRLNLASRKAANRARGDIAATVETKFEGLSKQFQEEVGDGEVMSQFTQTYKSVISQTIVGSEVVKREMQKEGDGYRAYVLMRMPIGRAQKALVQKIQSQQALNTTQAYKELEEDVEEYEERRRQQEARRQGQSSSQAENTNDGSGGETQEQQGGQQDEQSTGDAQTTGEETVQSSENPDTGGGASEVEIIESRLRQEMQPWLGTPYEFGGESRDGVDCSGLVRELYQEAFNVSLPRVTGDQVERGRPVSRSQLRAGDLVFFRTGDQQKHVGIYLDNQKFVHASSSQGVTTSPLGMDYWQEHYWTTRRLPII